MAPNSTAHQSPDTSGAGDVLQPIGSGLRPGDRHGYSVPGLDGDDQRRLHSMRALRVVPGDLIVCQRDRDVSFVHPAKPVGGRT